ncbi:MAG: hypothetical protein KY455_13325 [Euryarchaeota archaeon]|nr:hypothetical protein [Euryarchaeota archaeon]
MVPGSLRIFMVAVFALMLVPLSGCVDTGLDGEGGTSDPVVQEEAEADTEVATGDEETTATPAAEPAPTTATEDTVTDVARVPGTETAMTTTPADEVAPAPAATPTPSPTTKPSPATTPATTETTQTPTPTSTPAPTTTSTATTATTTPTATEDPVTAEEDGEEWPRDGSFVRYRTTGGASSPGGGFSTSHEADWHIVYTNGVWNGTCTWSRSERARQYDADNDTYHDEWTNTSGTETVSVAPPEGPTDVAIGDTVAVPHLVGCREGVFDELTVEERTTHSAPRQTDGSPTWYGYWKPEWPADAYAYWETESGLVLAWRDQRTNGYDDGWMVDTDAPLE